MVKIKMRQILFFAFLFPAFQSVAQNTVTIVGEMKNVMWKGQLNAVVDTDTLPKGNLYAMGPVAFLRGEVLLWNDTLIVSQVGKKGEMVTTVTENIGLPFTAYANIGEWVEIAIPKSVKDITGLELFLDSLSQPTDAPYFFKIEGQAKVANIHVVNLPEGTKVTSPAEAHQGLQDYRLKNCAFKALGFYSRNHHAIFTHHDTNMHIHLITTDGKNMGHLDGIHFDGNIKLYVGK